MSGGVEWHSSLALANKSADQTRVINSGVEAGYHVIRNA